MFKSLVIITCGEKAPSVLSVAEALLIRKSNEMLKHVAPILYLLLTLELRRLLFYQERTIWHTARSMNSLHWYFSKRKQKIACATAKAILRHGISCALHATRVTISSAINKKKKINKISRNRSRERRFSSRDVFVSSNCHATLTWRLFGLFLISIVIARATAGNWPANFEFGLSGPMMDRPFVRGADDTSADVSYTAPFSDETTCRWLSIKRMHTPPLTDPFPRPPPPPSSPVFWSSFFPSSNALFGIFSPFFSFFFFISNARHLA